MARDTSVIVYALLKSVPKPRDDDFLLILRTWLEEMGPDIDPNIKQTFRALLDLYRLKTISNFESIRRTRQKIQEENPEVRGQRYHARQEQGELFRRQINK